MVAIAQRIGRFAAVRVRPLPGHQANKAAAQSGIITTPPQQPLMRYQANIAAAIRREITLAQPLMPYQANIAAAKAALGKPPMPYPAAMSAAKNVFNRRFSLGRTVRRGFVFYEALSYLHTTPLKAAIFLTSAMALQFEFGKGAKSWFGKIMFRTLGIASFATPFLALYTAPALFTSAFLEGYVISTFALVSFSAMLRSSLSARANKDSEEEIIPKLAQAAIDENPNTIAKDLLKKPRFLSRWFGYSRRGRKHLIRSFLRELKNVDRSKFNEVLATLNQKPGGRWLIGRTLRNEAIKS